MDLKALKTFQRVAEHGSFIRAAEGMNYAQSTVTMQIQKLESDLGVQLIQRGKTIGLTEAGKLLYDQSRQITEKIERLEADVKSVQSGETGLIRLGVTEPTASYRLPLILNKFLSIHPKVSISLTIANTPLLSDALLKGDIDLALCSAPDFGTKFHFEPLFQEEFVLLVPDSHTLASQAHIVPDDLHGERLLITSATCPYRKKLEMVFKESGNVSINTMEIGSMTALKHYVAHGFGVAFVPKIELSPSPVGTTFRDVEGNLVDMTFGILSQSSELPFRQATARLYHFLKEEHYHTSDV